MIFSGIQPTGRIHLGNYFGAVQPWIRLQSDQNADCIFSIVDMHAITLPQEPKSLNQDIKVMLASLVACGLDPKKCILFKQSDVPEHTQLSWILSCLTTMAKLEILPQYKEKSAIMKEPRVGLFAYPVLQAADILLYKANEVPVGEDQSQQIHLAQHICLKFNKRYGQLFPFPKPVMSNQGFAFRLKSLRKPEKKMSKSDPDAKSRIQVTDEPEEILEKCKKALTDFTSNITFDPETRPGVSNLVMIHNLITGDEVETICQQHRNSTTAEYKVHLADIIIEHFKPIREKTNQLLEDNEMLDSILESGREKASEIAAKTLNEAKVLIGLKP